MKSRFEGFSVGEMIVVLGFDKFVTECLDKTVWDNMSEDGAKCLAELFVDLMLYVDAEQMIEVIEKVAAAINFGYSAGLRCALEEFMKKGKEK